MKATKLNTHISSCNKTKPNLVTIYVNLVVYLESKFCSEKQNKATQHHVMAYCV